MIDVLLDERFTGMDLSECDDSCYLLVWMKRHGDRYPGTLLSKLESFYAENFRRSRVEYSQADDYY